jgi:hypothetical protein
MLSFFHRTSSTTWIVVLYVVIIAFAVFASIDLD